jgi:hypothetical protein
MLDEI